MSGQKTVDGSALVRINNIDSTQGALHQLNHYWDPVLLQVVAVTGGAVDGVDVNVNNFPVSYPVTGTFWQTTQPISVASLPLPSGAATSAAQTTGNASLATLALESGGNLATLTAKDFATQTTLSALNTKVTACNTGAVVVSSGSITDGGSGKTLKSAVLSLTATGTVVSAVASKRIKVFAVKAICSAALSINFRDGGTTALEGVQSIAINGGYTESVNPPNFLFATTVGNSLDLVITGIGTVAGRVSYWDDDAT